MPTPTVKIMRVYTLPGTREGGGRRVIELLPYDEELGETVADWTAGQLADAGCTRHNFGPRYMAEETMTTDYRRGEEMDTTAELLHYDADQLSAVYRLMQA